MSALDAGLASRLKRDVNGLFAAVAQERLNRRWGMLTLHARAN